MLLKLVCGVVLFGLSSAGGQKHPSAPDPAAGELSLVEAYDMSAAAQLRPSCPGGCGLRLLLVPPGR